jgi:cell division protein FtsL
MLPVSDFKTYRISKKENNFNLVGKIKVKLLVTSSFIVFVLLFAQLVFANNLATEGEKIAGVEQEIQRLEAENTSLKVEIAKSSSLTNLSEKAKKLGYQKPSEIIVP